MAEFPARRRVNAAPPAFRGFPPEAFKFLAGLERHNEKRWFEEHRDVYEGAVVEPTLAFVVALGDSLRTLAASVVAEPRVGGSLFRIHRDTRFSRDKRPYKTHVGIRLRDGDTATSSRCTGPLFYVEFDARSLRLGVGVKEFDGPTLAAYRRALGHDFTLNALEMLARQARRAGHELLGDTLARAPADLRRPGNSELLRRRGLFVRCEMPHPEEISDHRFVPFCRRWFASYAPLFAELRAIARAAMPSRS